MKSAVFHWLLSILGAFPGNSVSSIFSFLNIIPNLLPFLYLFIDNHSPSHDTNGKSWMILVYLVVYGLAFCNVVVLIEIFLNRKKIVALKKLLENLVISDDKMKLQTSKYVTLSCIAAIGFVVFNLIRAELQIFMVVVQMYWWVVWTTRILTLIISVDILTSKINVILLEIKISRNKSLHLLQNQYEEVLSISDLMNKSLPATLLASTAQFSIFMLDAVYWSILGTFKNLVDMDLYRKFKTSGIVRQFYTFFPELSCYATAFGLIFWFLFSSCENCLKKVSFGLLLD